MKITILAMAIITCMILYSAMAETNQEIRFLDIPWNTDIVTYTRSILSEMDVQKDNVSVEIESRSFGFIFDESEQEMYKAHSFTEDCGLFYSTVLVSDLEMSMHQLPVDFIHIEAIAPQAQEHDPANSTVTNVICAFDRKNIPYLNRAHSDVFDLLCAAYGSPDIAKTQEGYSIEYVWFGAKETYCNLSIGLNSKGTEGSVTIRYGTNIVLNEL